MFDEHVKVYRAHLAYQKWLSELVHDGNYRWHPDDPCLSLMYNEY